MASTWPHDGQVFSNMVAETSLAVETTLHSMAQQPRATTFSTHPPTTQTTAPLAPMAVNAATSTFQMSISNQVALSSVASATHIQVQALHTQLSWWLAWMICHTRHLTEYKRRHTQLHNEDQTYQLHRRPTSFLLNPGDQLLRALQDRDARRLRNRGYPDGCGEHARA